MRNRTICGLLIFLPINDVLEGDDSNIDILFGALKEFHEAAMEWSCLVHCRNGANRSMLFQAAYLIARYRIPVRVAIDHLTRLRFLTDIPMSRHGYPNPYSFLEYWESKLHRLFRDDPAAPRSWFILPQVVRVSGAAMACGRWRVR